MSCHTLRLGTTSALVWFLFAVPAAATPEFSPNVETELVGATEAPRGDMIGSWSEAPGRLTLDVHDTSGVSLWLSQKGDLADGFVRWRISEWRSSGAKLLLRARVDAARTFGLSGYVLSVSRDGVELLRSDDGVVRPTGFGAKAKGLGNVANLEVAVWMVGPQGGVQVFDGRTLAMTPIVSFAWTDTAYQAGRVGVFVERRDGKCPITTGLSIRSSGLAPAVAPDLDTRVPGPWRFLFLDGGAWPTVEPELREIVRVLDDPAGRLLVRADEAAAERLRRAGVVRGRLEVDTPLRLIDDTYLASRQAFDQGIRTYDREGGIWHDADMLRARLDEWKTRDPRVHVYELGKTHQGRAILAVHVAARAAGGPSILLIGGVHGCELIGTEIVLDALRTLIEGGVDDSDLRDWHNQVEIWAIPDANPDGRAAFIDTSIYRGRKNGRDSDGNGLLGPREGVDLNRNYPFGWNARGEEGSKGEPLHDWYRGPFAGSEPEVQALLRLAEREKFVAAISFHSKGTMLLYPYQSKFATLPRTDEAAELAKEMGAAIPVQMNGRRLAVLREMYPVDGVEEDTLRHAHGTLALLIEAAEENPEEPAKRRRLVEDARPAWQWLLQRVAEGPRLSLRVVDTKRRPLVAQVEVIGDSRPDRVTWTTRCRDGRYDRLLPSEGSVRVRVSVGDVAKEQTVYAAEGLTQPVVLSLPVDAPLSHIPTPALDELSIDGRCAKECSRCEPDLVPRACWIDEACCLAGTVGPGGTVCAPGRDAFGWSWNEYPVGFLSDENADR